MFEILFALAFSLLMLFLGALSFVCFLPQSKLPVDLVINTLSSLDTPELLSSLELKNHGRLIAVVKNPTEQELSELLQRYKIERILYI